MSNNGFKWRPNDNSSVTSHRYEIEAEKWVNAVDAAKSRNRKRPVTKDLGTISMILEGVVAFIAIILVGIFSGIQFCIGGMKGILEDYRAGKVLERHRNGRKQAATRNMAAAPSVSERKRPPRLLFDKNGNAWFIWEFLLRTLIIFSVIFFTTALYHLYMKPDFELTDKYFLIYVGGISTYFGFMGSMN